MGYIPRSFDKFYNWEKQFIAGVQSLIDNGAAFPAQMLSEFNVLKALSQKYDTAHEKAANKSSRSPAETQKRTSLRPPFQKALGAFAQMWFANNQAIKDGTRRDLGLTVKDKTRSAAAPINEQVFFSRQQLGGAVVWFRCRAKEDSKRPSKLRRDTDIEIRLSIGGEPGNDPASYPVTVISSKASFRHEFGPENAGSTVHIIMRWHSRTSKQFGPWSAPASFILGD